MRKNRFRNVSVAAATAATLAGIGAGALAQTQEPAQAPAAAAPASTPAAAPAPASSLDQFAWLRGCWAGKANRYDFIEQWSPPRAGMMVGVSHTMEQDQKQAAPARTDDYSYLRLESRPDGIYYVAIASGKKEGAFKFASTSDVDGRPAYTFTSTGTGFPERIVYVRGNEGWLYATVEGNVGTKAKRVVYPMQHVDCLTGAPLER